MRSESVGPRNAVAWSWLLIGTPLYGRRLFEDAFAARRDQAVTFVAAGIGLRSKKRSTLKVQ